MEYLPMIDVTGGASAGMRGNNGAVCFAVHCAVVAGSYGGLYGQFRKINLCDS